MADPTNQELHEELLSLRGEIQELKVSMKEVLEWVSAGKVGAQIVRWLLATVTAIGVAWAAWHGQAK